MLQEHKKYHEEATAMVFSATQTTAFIEDGAQMGITSDTVTQLQNKGFVFISDLVDFKKSTIKKIDDNLRCTAERISDPNPGAAPGATILALPLVFGINSQKCLLVASKML